MTTQIYGIFGFPLKHTLSPAMQEKAFEKSGIDASYLALELDPSAFKKLARDFPKTLLAGFNVTVPYKQTVMPYLDTLSKDAAIIGAVNTVKRSGKKFKGYNTDWMGFVDALKEARFNPAGKKAVVLGAGGAARACVYGLMKKGIRAIALFNRHPARAMTIKRDFNKTFPGTEVKVFALNGADLKQELGDADLLLNSTSVGLKSDDSALLRENTLPGRKLLVYDLIYNPPETPFLKMARRGKKSTLNGVSMLLFQGARAFEIWTGRKAPVGLMRKVLLEKLGQKK